MKLHLTQAEGNHLITAYAADKVSVNNKPYHQSLILHPTKLQENWAVTQFDALTEKDFALIKTFEPEVVILGTGTTHRFVHPSLTKVLSDNNIPVECMTTDAACRTYNILMSEGRNVVAALIL